jgi:predicted enzyme related to lactoylglutathione lyase
MSPSRSLEDAVAHIKRLGGSELSGVIDVPTVGRMQMLKDPQGAAFYIIQPAPRDERPESAPEVGEASWHELMTTDSAAAMKFYSEVFGWRPTESVDMGPMGKYQMFNRPHGMIGGMMNKPPEMAAAPRCGRSTSVSLISTRPLHASKRTAARSPTDLRGARRRLDRQRGRSAGRSLRAAREESVTQPEPRQPAWKNPRPAR